MAGASAGVILNAGITTESVHERMGDHSDRTGQAPGRAGGAADAARSAEVFGNMPILPGKRVEDATAGAALSGERRRVAGASVSQQVLRVIEGGRATAFV